MSGFTVSNCKRVAVGSICMMILVVVLFSAFYIAAETDHDCVGDDCPICACIQQCELILHQFTNGVVAQAAAAATAVSLLVFAVAIPAYTFIQATPVSRKVQLNN